MNVQWGWRVVVGSLLIVGSGTNLARASDESPVCAEVARVFAGTLHLEAECGGTYSHYRRAAPRRAGRSRAATELRIAGFNVLNLGREADFRGARETPYKDPKLLADIINRFDLVAAIELKHFAKEDKALNTRIEEVGADLSQRVVPPYLEVLTALHALGDTSWSLIIANDLHSSAPDDTLNNELAGFYYRASRVAGVATPYCERLEGAPRGNIACAAKASEFRAEVARKPFLASFRSGTRTFTYAAVHFRYNPPVVAGSTEIDRAVFDPMMEIFDPESLGIKKDDERARFSEVMSVARFLDRVAGQPGARDLLLYGDFNLPAPVEALSAKQRAYQAAWAAALEPLAGHRTFVNAPSTLGFEELNEEFDHFVFNPEARALAGCEGGVFDFTDAAVFPEGARAVRGASVEGYERRLAGLIKIDRSGEVVPRYSEAATQFLLTGYRRFVVEAERGRLDPYRALVSDHAPVFMTCPVAAARRR